MTSPTAEPTTPPVAQQPTTQPPSGAAPGMPKTGGFGIDHLGDIYGLALALAAGLGGLIVVGGWAVRRRTAEQVSDK